MVRSVGSQAAACPVPRRVLPRFGLLAPAAIVQVRAERSLVVKVTAGKDEPERCNQALTVAAAAVASGVPVSLWLTGEASWFALPDGCPDLSLPHATPLPDLFAAVLGGGSVTLCTQCAARREITEDDVVDGVRIAGATTFVAEILADGAQALVY
jgi:predicted peroxiredoxin